MVDVKKIVLLILVAGVIVAAGLYWNSSLNDFSPTDPNSDERTLQDSFDESKWSVSPEATISLGDRQESSTEDVYDRFTVPGQVTFGDNTPAQSVKLTVKIMPVDPSRAGELLNQPQGDNPIAQLMKGGPRSNFDTQAITQMITTDESGRFSIEDAVPGIYQVLVGDTNLVKTDSTSRIEIPSRRQPLKLKVARTASLKGTVLNPDGNPIEATVEYMDGRDQFQTNSQGQFTIDDVPPGKPINFLRIYKEGFREYHLSLPAPKPGETIEESFSLERGSSLQVTIRTEKDEPVTDGTIILTREDDKKIPLGARQSVPHGKARVIQLDSNGRGTFESIIPGRVKISLMFAQILAEPRVLEIEAGENRQITITGQEGDPFSVELLDESTGQPVEGIQPAMRVFDEDGNELEPGFIISSRKKDDAYKGIIDRAAESIRVRVTSLTNAYQTKEAQFDRSDLPDLTVRLVPSKKPTPEPETPPGLTSFTIQKEGALDWGTIDSVDVWILDAKSGSQKLARTGTNQSVLSEPYPLEVGEYYFYAVLDRSDERSRVAFRPFSINSKHPGSRQITLEESASVEGTVGAANKSPSDLQVGLSLLGNSNENQERNIQGVFYPERLRITPGKDGSYRLDHIPPGEAAELHVTSTRRGSSDRAAGTVLERQRIPELSSGTTKTVAPIQLSE
jgi:protocatechuate 3,4-dioxygenase beta subunit